MLRSLAPLTSAKLFFKLATFMTAALAISAVSADTEFTDNIPIDLARALLSGAGTAMEIRIYSDIPDGFPEFMLPDGATVLGSVDQGRNRQVILGSEGDGQQQLAELIDSLQQNDFLLLSPMGATTPRTGFVSATPQNLGIPSQLCHDTQGLLYLRQHTEADRTFINLTSLPGTSRGNFSCAGLAAQASNRGSPAFLNASRGGGSLQNSMPRLVLPDEATTQSPSMPLFLSGSPQQAESRIGFSVAWPLSEAYEFFAGQLTEQDWILDGETIGDRVALGAWTREENTQMLLGTLRLVSGEADGYEAVFEVSVLE
ncbi:hypothetical protein [Pseudohongiella acticola]|nr:hypothetical protein [Pseudohongiella acticola]